MKTYHAVGSKVLLRSLNALKVDDSSGLKMVGKLFLPAASTMQNEEGNPIMEWEVVSKGPDCKVVAPGDIVLANGLIVMKVKCGDQELGMIGEDALVAVVKNVPDEVEKKD
jgi:hypothetical protein